MVKPITVIPLFVGSKELGVNSKKPPHLCGKYLKPPVFGKIAKNHQFWTNLFQCALIVRFRLANMISDKWTPLSMLTW
jgi:hypothetical protein